MKVRRLVKYVKAWAALKFSLKDGRPSSILLTVLVNDAVKAVGAANLGADDEALRDILEEIIDRLENNTEVPNPVNTSENLTHMDDGKMTAFIDRTQNVP